MHRRERAKCITRRGKRGRRKRTTRGKIRSEENGVKGQRVRIFFFSTRASQQVTVLSRYPEARVVGTSRASENQVFSARCFATPAAARYSNVMVRTVGGECTGSCRLGHVFLTSLLVPPPSLALNPSLPPLPYLAARFFFFVLLSLSAGERSDEEEAGNRATGEPRERHAESERERRASSGRRRWCRRR